MMRFVVLGISLALVAGEAHAISRYQTMRMGCDKVQSVLDREGAAILRWQSRRNPSLPLYGRYVRDRGFCDLGEVTVFKSVPTADDPSCTVKQCVRPDIEERRWFMHDD